MIEKTLRIISLIYSNLCTKVPTPDSGLDTKIKEKCETSPFPWDPAIWMAMGQAGK